RGRRAARSICSRERNSVNTSAFLRTANCSTSNTHFPLPVAVNNREIYMRKYALAIGVMLALFFVAVPAHQAQQKGGQDETGDYTVAVGCPEPSAKPVSIQGAISGVFAETPNRIFVMNRGEIKLPEKLPTGFNGYGGSTGERAASPPYEPRNFILI